MAQIHVLNSSDENVPVKQDSSGGIPASLASNIAGERNEDSATNNLTMVRCEWNLTVVTGVADTDISGVAGAPVHVGKVRVGGTAALAGAVAVQDYNGGAPATKETIAAATAVGVERDYALGTKFDTGCRINLANVADTLLVWWRPQ